MLPTGSIRLAAHGRIEDLPGYAEGAWWVQDAAAALVARVAGDVAGRTVADLCAAPGGKTAGLAAAGATVTAVDVSPKRLDRLRANLQRLGLSAEVVAADAASWAPERTFDVVILDAPCTATGTIRRHPDILRLKRPEDVGPHGRSAAQRCSQTRPAWCGRAASWSTARARWSRRKANTRSRLFSAANRISGACRSRPTELGADPAWVTAAGDLRTLPCHLELEPPELSGIDGFYVARLQRLT